MTRPLRFIYIGLLSLFSCNTQRMICPAYQSAFIFDKPKQTETFSYYNANKSQPREVVASNSKTLILPARDSTWTNSIVLPGPALPKESKWKRDKYLLLPKRTYKRALKSLQTIAMIPLYPKQETDSTDIKKALDSAARTITDTLTVQAEPGKKEQKKDTTYVISIAKEKFNVEQDNYMWYLRDFLVLPDVRLAMEDAKAEKVNKANVGKKKKVGFFKSIRNIFKRKPKPKPKIDTTAVTVSNDPGQANDSTAVTTTPLKKKKGLLGLFRKKSKTPPMKNGEAKKKEEDDGF